MIIDFILARRLRVVCPDRPFSSGLLKLAMALGISALFSLFGGGGDCDCDL
jgi:hypothetical protein